MKKLTETYITIIDADGDDWLFFQLGDSLIFTDEDHQDFFQAESYVDFQNWVEQKYEIKIKSTLHQTHAQWTIN